MQSMLASSIPKKKNLAIPVLETYEFVPNEANLPLDLSLRVNAQIIVENSSLTRTFPSLEVLDSGANEESQNFLLTPILMDIIKDFPMVQSDAKVLSPKPLEVKDVNVVNNSNLRAEAKAYALVIGTNLLKNNQVIICFILLSLLFLFEKLCFHCRCYKMPFLQYGMVDL